MDKEEEMSRVEEEEEEDDEDGMTVDADNAHREDEENQNGSGGNGTPVGGESGPSSSSSIAPQQPPPPGPSGPPHNVVIKWAGKNIEIEDINGLKTVRDLKLTIQSKTGVQPERQKLLNLNFKGKLALDDCLLANLNLKVGMKIMMMGSLERDYESVDVPPEERPDVNNDLDIPEDDDKPLENKEVYLNKVTRRIKEYNVKILNPLRDGKKLLVLDIDYTLFDHRSAAETGVELMRPFLHEFLTSAYADYDIVIWSATSMKWIEEKMKLLGVASHSSYKIAFYLDYLAMISVHTQKYGVIDVKPLGVIWGKFPQFSSHNTIMFDDLRRNFIMNPQSGLRIRPFRSAHVNRSNDRELLRLASYLRKIARLDDFSQLNHKRWESYLSKANARKHYSSHSNSKRHQEDRSGGSGSGSGGPSSAGGSNSNANTTGAAGGSSEEPAA